jgi:tetratricopeptide (TPR) repeat protein
MRFITVVLLLSSSPLCLAQAASPPLKSQSASEQWQRLLDRKQPTAAEKLCTQWDKSGDHEHQVEAQKCLANVALARGSHVSLEGNEVGGGGLGEGYTPEAVNAALKSLNKGILLAPQDISIHEGRLHVLEVAGRFDDMAKALDESITIYKGPGTPDVWLAYCPELADLGFPTAGLKFAEILATHYPDNPDVLGNVSAFHNMLKQWDQGLPYIRRAMELRPNDPIDTWNLGWTLNRLGQYAEADKWMSKSLQLEKPHDPDAKERRCLYAKFEVTQLKKKKEGCASLEKNCAPDDRKECASSK